MAVYDPTKRYEWSNSEKFEITGRDLGLFLNMTRAVLSLEMAAPILLADRANSAIENIMAEYVEKGVIKELEDNENGK